MNECLRCTRPRWVAAIFLAMLAGCGGGGGSGSSPVLFPQASAAPAASAASGPVASASPASSAPDFAPVVQAIESDDSSDFAVLIGNGAGILFEYVKGSFPVTGQRAIGSSSKWYTSATIMQLVDQGTLKLSDHPQDFLPYWTRSASDPRSRITLAQLLSFTSGFNGDPVSGGCTDDPATTLQACARTIYEGNVASAPGAAFSYGPQHMHIAAAMAEQATGQSFNAIFRTRLADPLGMTVASRYVLPSSANPLVSGGAASTARDYALFLQALLNGTGVAERDTFLQDRTAGIPFLFRPNGVEQAGDWHYALGAWLECDEAAFEPSCAAARIYSSPGSFGWTPWIDLKNGYFALIARRGERFSTPQAIGLEQSLQPLIEAVLRR